MQDFAEAWDLTLDRSKTVFWASQAADRKWLCAQGASVLHYARDLGGHLQYTRSATNSTVTARIRAMEDMWPRLATSHAGYAAKLRALEVAAWPRAFYGVSICQLGNRYISALRTSALKGLGMSRPGSNAAIHLALVESPSADPGFVLLRSSVVDLRIQLQLQVAVPILDHLASGVSVRCPGPVGFFLQRIHQIGWAWDPGMSKIRTGSALFDLWTCSPRELQIRLERAWEQSVANQACNGLVSKACKQQIRYSPDVPSLDSHLSIRRCFAWLSMGPSTLRIDGEAAPNCRFCGAQDSAQHRVQECGHFQSGRVCTGFADLLAQDCLVPAQCLHAWAQRPSLQVEFQELLASLPDPPRASRDLGGMDLFTDGSCTQPGEPRLSLASWAITVDSVHGTPSVLASGPLPGICQTTFRAELFAIRVLFRVARASSAPFRIWTDCLGVVRKVRALRQSLQPPAAMSLNADLWQEVWEAMQDLQVQFDINHLPSHEDLEAHTDLADKWLLRGNHYADRVAGNANSDRQDTFWDRYHRFADEVAFQASVQKTVIDFHKWMAHTATRASHPTNHREGIGFQVRGNTPFRWPTQQPGLDKASGLYGAWFIALVCPWLASVTAGTDADLCWVSWVHLVTDFVMDTGIRPPLRWRSNWLDVRKGPAQGLYPWNMATASRSFAKQVRYLAKEAGISLQTTETRPCGTSFHLQTSCVWTRYPKARLELVDRWLTLQMESLKGGKRCHRHLRLWRAIPQPPQNAVLLGLR